MNTAIKAGIAGALAFAGVAAHASIAQPSSGSSDAILFAEVVNAAGTAAVASYAGDTGVSLATIASGAASGTVLGSDANLAKLFAADASGDSIYFAVLGGQYTGNATTSNFKTAGVAQFITTTNSNSTSSLANDSTQSLVKFAGLNGDVSTINSNSGGANSYEGANPVTAGVWDFTGGSLNIAYWDGGATSNGNLIGSAENLYSVTAGAGGTTATKVAYTPEGTASLSAAGLALTGTTGTPPPVGGGGGTTTTPLPAAVWLLGSGLLGLTGVARRKLKV